MAIKTKQAEVELRKFTLKRLNSLSDKSFGNKATAVGHITQHSTKQGLVRRLAETGGVTVEQIEEMFGINRKYASDILSKLRKKGVVLKRDSYGAYHAE